MLTVRWLLPLLVIDNKKHIVEMDEWAKNRLSSDEYQQYISDSAIFLQYYNEQVKLGNIELLDYLTETFVTSDGRSITVKVGHSYKRKEDVGDHPKFLYWVQRISEDPNVIYFPYEIIS